MFKAWSRASSSRFKIINSSAILNLTQVRSVVMTAAGAQSVDTSGRLTRLRELMTRKEYDLKAFLVPSEDQHSSEYLAPCDERRAFISGFDGSAGFALVTLKDAYLFTDGRYFLQAEKQLDRNWTLMKQGITGVPTWQEFLSKKLEPGSRIGIDPTLISAVDAESLKKSLTPRKSELVSLNKNLVDVVWGQDRPARPQNKVFPLATLYTGESSQDKINRIREELKKKNVEGVVVTMLDEIAWLFNLRGSDIEFNPVFFAYAVVKKDRVLLFIDSKQVDDTFRGHLPSSVEIHEYKTFFSFLQELSKNVLLGKDNQILIGDKASLAVAEALGLDNAITARSPLADFKSIKNSSELEGFRQSHIRDGAALARYFSWLQKELDKGTDLNESQVADKLERLRSELDLFQGLSFATVSATGPNAAIIHYKPDAQDCAVVKQDQLYLCDSGAQFLDGTTDVTRTWHFGNPSEEERRAFTRVLQGHIAIDTAIFPAGTTGFVIDSWARRALWQDGLDYRHGTGHGVGHFLNVHEGPQGIGTRIAYNNTPLKAGMTVSNEPGYYSDGEFGIRIENIVLVREAQTRHKFGDKAYLGFEHVTMSPIQKKLVLPDLMTPGELKWLNDYHAEVYRKVHPLLETVDPEALAWLKEECSPL